MPGMITIRRVPDEVRNTLKSRAADRGQSLQAYLLDLLEKTVEKPTVREVLRQVEARLEASESSVTTEEILEALREGRR